MQHSAIGWCRAPHVKLHNIQQNNTASQYYKNELIWRRSNNTFSTVSYQKNSI